MIEPIHIPDFTRIVQLKNNHSIEDAAELVTELIIAAAEQDVDRGTTEKVVDVSYLELELAGILAVPDFPYSKTYFPGHVELTEIGKLVFTQLGRRGFVPDLLGGWLSLDMSHAPVGSPADLLRQRSTGAAKKHLFGYRLHNLDNKIVATAAQQGTKVTIQGPGAKLTKAALAQRTNDDFVRLLIDLGYEVSPRGKQQLIVSWDSACSQLDRSKAVPVMPDCIEPLMTATQAAALTRQLRCANGMFTSNDKGDPADMDWLLRAVVRDIIQNHTFPSMKSTMGVQRGETKVFPSYWAETTKVFVSRNLNSPSLETLGNAVRTNLETAGFATSTNGFSRGSFRIDLAKDAPIGSLADVVRQGAWEHYRDRILVRRGLALAGKAIATAWNNGDGYTIQRAEAACQNVADQAPRLRAEFEGLAADHHYPLTPKGVAYYRVSL